jgi:hypothetical protein
MKFIIQAMNKQLFVMLLPWICNISGKLVQMNEERLSRIEMLVASDLIPSGTMSFLAYC